MARACFLVVDNEYPGSISTRKLVIESAKLNVITAYSAKEAVQTLAQFPSVDGVVLDSEVEETNCEQLVAEFACRTWGCANHSCISKRPSKLRPQYSSRRKL